MILRAFSVAVYWVAVALLQVVCHELAAHGWSDGLLGAIALAVALFSGSIRSRIRLDADRISLALSPTVFGALFVWTVLAAERASRDVHRVAFRLSLLTILGVGLLAFIADLVRTLRAAPKKATVPPTADGAPGVVETHRDR
jgi:hypothetical protein